MARSPLKRPLPIMLSPATLTRKVAGRLVISRRWRSISSSMKSSAGLGKPAETASASIGSGMGLLNVIPTACTRILPIRHSEQIGNKGSASSSPARCMNGVDGERSGSFGQRGVDADVLALGRIDRKGNGRFGAELGDSSYFPKLSTERLQPTQAGRSTPTTACSRADILRYGWVAAVRPPRPSEHHRHGFEADLPQEGPQRFGRDQSSADGQVGNRVQKQRAGPTVLGVKSWCIFLQLIELRHQ